MGDLSELLAKNKIWAKQKKAIDPDFFIELSKGQSPQYLWIGCSDSRVSPATLAGLDQGDLFVTRNISNLMLHTDLNSLSVLQYAVDVLKISDVIICGHYGCGGINAAMGVTPFGLTDSWLRNIKDVFLQHKNELYDIKDPVERSNRLVELNIFKQVYNTCYTNTVQAAWVNGKDLTVHGCVFDMSTGLLKKLKCSVSSIEQIDNIYKIDI
ncbi:MAG: carbonic anhydrase [Legionellales bacterium]|nr:carbonic anhydrase [Legionellales bacterium]